MSKIFTGTVVSTKMQNTVTVMIERKFQHPRFKKVVIRHKKFKAHCENPNVKTGDVVTIKETKPISKDKKFIVVENAEAKKNK